MRFTGLEGIDYAEFPSPTTRTWYESLRIGARIITDRASLLVKENAARELASVLMSRSGPASLQVNGRLLFIYTFPSSNLRQWKASANRVGDADSMPRKRSRP